MSVHLYLHLCMCLCLCLGLFLCMAILILSIRVLYEEHKFPFCKLLRRICHFISFHIISKITSVIYGGRGIKTTWEVEEYFE